MDDDRELEPELPRHVRARSISAPLRLDLTGAAIDVSRAGADPRDRESSAPQATIATHTQTDVARRNVPEAPAISLPRQRDAVRHFAMDLGGSLVKLVYFSPGGLDEHGEPRGGRLHFRKFASAHLEDCMEFIEFKKLHEGGSGGDAQSARDGDG